MLLASIFAPLPIKPLMPPWGSHLHDLT
jgi:hypothetical protein